MKLDMSHTYIHAHALVHIHTYRNKKPKVTHLNYLETEGEKGG